MNENKKLESNNYGLIGLGVMGRNLALNMADHGIDVTVFSISEEERNAVQANLKVSDSIHALVEELATPRVLFLMVTAGEAVDLVLEELLPLLSAGDSVIDGGNSNYLDTERRVSACRLEGINFVGVGISGGEEGARNGASVMVGGDQFDHLDRLFAAVATEAHGEPCYGWLGRGGAGHFVKTVHNGIEYGVMQLIAESYDFLVRGCGRSLAEAKDWFESLRGGVLDSYLIDITASILATRDEDGLLLEKVKDVAEQKGTGKWCVDAALTMGVPVPTIMAAVTERQLSNQVTTREQLSALSEQIARADGQYEDDLEQALYISIIATFAQGLSLIQRASGENNWGTDVSVALKLWRGGCIIRAKLLADLIVATESLPMGENVLLHESVSQKTSTSVPSLRRVASAAVSTGVPMPAMISALSYLDSMYSARLSTHLIQAQRDCFGAHQFERIDKPGRFHASWLGAEQ